MMNVPVLAHTTPESQGMPSEAILAFVDSIEQSHIDLHSMMLLRHGRVIAEGWWDPYKPHYPHMLYSLSKSFTSTAIGLLVAEGKLSVDDPVLAFFPDEAPAEPSAHLRAMCVRHLLSMSTGHDADTTDVMRGDPAGRWMRAFLALPVEHAPGTHFLYNTGATYMLSAIVQRLSGVRLLDYLRPRLFEPLGIEHPTWEVSPEGIDTGGFGLSIITADIARFGQLYLQKGIWEGKRVVPETWVTEASQKQISNGTDASSDWTQGYGYQFWRCRHDAYRGDGAFGQYCIVMPAQDAVLAITAGVSDMQVVLDHVWKHLLPSMGDGALAEHSSAQAALRAKLASLQLPSIAGRPDSPIAASVSGKLFSSTERPSEIESASFHFVDGGCEIEYRDPRHEYRVRAGFGAWTHCTLRDDLNGPQEVAASGAWTDDRTYTLRIWQCYAPQAITLTCSFDGGRVIVESRVNVSFDPITTQRFEGRLVQSDRH